MAAGRRAACVNAPVGVKVCGRLESHVNGGRVATAAFSSRWWLERNHGTGVGGGVVRKVVGQVWGLSNAGTGSKVMQQICVVASAPYAAASSAVMAGVRGGRPAAAAYAAGAVVLVYAAF